MKLTITVRKYGKQNEPFDVVPCSLPWRGINNGFVEDRGGRERRGTSKARQIVHDAEIQARGPNRRWGDASVGKLWW